MKSNSSLKLIKIVAITLLFYFSGMTSAFAKKNDFGVWLDLAATKKIHSATFGLISEIYTRNNSSTLDRLSIGLKGDYQFLPWLSAGAGNVVINFFRAGYTELADRFYLQVEPSWHHSHFYCTFRERMQITLFPQTRTDALSSYYWRNRLEIIYKHDSSKIEPLTDLETLVRLGDANFTPTLGYRVTLGFNYHPTFNQKIKVYGMLTDGSIVSQYIFGVSYEFRL
jgi:hypothetical protein